eukprot:6481086-Amphidinium_carterae.1
MNSILQDWIDVAHGSCNRSEILNKDNSDGDALGQDCIPFRTAPWVSWSLACGLFQHILLPVVGG